MTDLMPFALSLAVLASFALIAGGVYVVARGPRQAKLRGWLMLGAALVILVNAALYASAPAAPPAAISK